MSAFAGFRDSTNTFQASPQAAPGGGFTAPMGRSPRPEQSFDAYGDQVRQAMAPPQPQAPQQQSTPAPVPMQAYQPSNQSQGQSMQAHQPPQTPAPPQPQAPQSTPQPGDAQPIAPRMQAQSNPEFGRSLLAQKDLSVWDPLAERVGPAAAAMMRQRAEAQRQKALVGEE